MFAIDEKNRVWDAVSSFTMTLSDYVPLRRLVKAVLF